MKRRGVVTVALVAAVVIIAGIYLASSQGSQIAQVVDGTQGQTTRVTPGSDTISLPRGVSICSVKCDPAGPYLTASISVNASTPLASIQLFINGTYESTTRVDNAGTFYTYQFKGVIDPSPLVVAIYPGKPYNAMLVASFRDGSTFTVSTNAVAS